MLIGPPPLNRDLTPEERGAQLAQFTREVEHEQFWDTARMIACISSEHHRRARDGLLLRLKRCAVSSVVWAALDRGLRRISVSLLRAYRRYLERTGET